MPDGPAAEAASEPVFSDSLQAMTTTSSDIPNDAAFIADRMCIVI
jgi:hypothetical protein